MPVTLRDVARKAGVSIKTVSRVINNQAEITDETRERVQTVIDELGYRPNALARSLLTGKTSTVAVVIPQITDPFFPEVMLGVEHIARQYGYNVFLCNTNNDPEVELFHLDFLETKRVDGIILCGSRLSASQLTSVTKQHRLAILTSRAPRGSAVISILGEAGLTEITSHLIRLGHGQIGHIGWEVLNDEERLSGYMRALRENGIDIDRRRICLTPTISIDSGYAATKRLLGQAPEVTALTCYNDLMAIGAIRACNELNRRVPDDIAIVGFDDIPLASLVTPSLTTMHVPRYRLGEMIMDLLLRVIASDGKLEEHSSIAPSLVIRETCGARKTVKSR